MKRHAYSVTAAVVLLTCCLLLTAQTPSAPRTPQIGKLIPLNDDKGVSRAVLLDRPEVQVSRVEIQPGAARRVHQHDNLKFHLFLPMTPGIELTRDATNYTPAPAGQAYFMEKGEPHGFRNTSSEVAKALEVFIRLDPKPVPSAARVRRPEALNKEETLALAMALGGLSTSRQ